MSNEESGHIHNEETGETTESTNDGVESCPRKPSESWQKLRTTFVEIDEYRKNCTIAAKELNWQEEYKRIRAKLI